MAAGYSTYARNSCSGLTVISQMESYAKERFHHRRAEVLLTSRYGPMIDSPSFKLCSDLAFGMWVKTATASEQNG